jgi:tRNA wybutosine-synthesizing protein 3
MNSDLTQIIHVLCRDLPAASRLHHIAVASGYRESGISISALGTPQEKVLVAVRTTAIGIQIPLACYEEETRTVKPFGLTRSYLVHIIRIINDKFQDNDLRKQRLFASLQETFTNQPSEVFKESKEERRTRKRLEGLKLQAMGRKVHGDNSHERSTQETDTLYDDVPLDQLITK